MFPPLPPPRWSPSEEDVGHPCDPSPPSQFPSLPLSPPLIPISSSDPHVLYPVLTPPPPYPPPPRWSPPEEDVGPRVLQSANKLFFKIRASITRCSRMISKGETLLALSQVWGQKAWGHAFV